MSQILQHQASSFILEFEVKGLPKMSNQLLRGHWRTKHAYAKRWKDWVKAITLHYRPIAPLHRAQLTLTRFSSKEPDFDGLVSSFKCVIDALVESRILENDKQSNIGQPSYLHDFAKQREGKIRVKIEET